MAKTQRRGSVTVKAAWIGVAGLIAATVLAWALGIIRPFAFTKSVPEQSATAETGGVALNIQGDSGDIQIGDTVLEVSDVWNASEKRLLSRTLDNIENSIENHNWDSLTDLFPALSEHESRPTAQLIEEEVLGLGFKHNNLRSKDPNRAEFDGLENIQSVDFHGIETARKGIAVITGVVTLKNGSRQDITFELELSAGVFAFVFAEG